jgi:hypothetical protein
MAPHDDPQVSHEFANGVLCYDPAPIIWANDEDCLHDDSDHEVIVGIAPDGSAIRGDAREYDSMAEYEEHMAALGDPDLAVAAEDRARGERHGRWARENNAAALDKRGGQPLIADVLRESPEWAAGYVKGATIATAEGVVIAEQRHIDLEPSRTRAK